jgi:hypothetical protein
MNDQQQNTQDTGLPEQRQLPDIAKTWYNLGVKRKLTIMGLSVASLALLGILALDLTSTYKSTNGYYGTAFATFCF